MRFEMKRFVTCLCAAFAAVLFLSSCDADKDKFGDVGYNYGFKLDYDVSPVQDEKDYILYVYRTEFGKIQGATVEDEYVYMNGQYVKTDIAIINACSVAEMVLSDTKFTGSYRFRVNGVYTSGTDENLYVKDFGPRNK